MIWSQTAGGLASGDAFLFDKRMLYETMLLALCLLVFAGSFFGVRFYGDLALKLGWVDKPDAVRKQQRSPVPTSASAPAFLCFLTGSYLFGCFAGVVPSPFDPSATISNKFILFLLLTFATLATMLLGFVDDRRELNGKIKLFWQFVVAVVFLTIAFKRVANNLDVYPQTALVCCFCAMVFWLLGTINSFNLLDGADGFLTTFAICCSVTLACVARLHELALSEGLCWILTASLCGFWFHNKPSAKVYLGDCGSLTLGFLIGGFALNVFFVDQASSNAVGEVQTEYAFRPMGAICLLALPIADSFFAIIRRRVLGRSIFAPDLAHLHHRLQRRYGRGAPTLVALVAIQLPLCAFSYAGARFNSELIPFFGATGVLSFLFFRKIFGYEETAMALVKIYAKVSRKLGRNDDKVLFVAIQNRGRWQEFWNLLVKQVQNGGCEYCSLAMNLPSAEISWFGEMQRRLGKTFGQAAQISQESQTAHNMISPSVNRSQYAVPLKVDNNVVGLLKVRFGSRSASLKQELRAVVRIHDLCAQALAFFGDYVEWYTVVEKKDAWKIDRISSSRIISGISKGSRELFEGISKNAPVK